MIQRIEDLITFLEVDENGSADEIQCIVDTRTEVEQFILQMKRELNYLQRKRHDSLCSNRSKILLRIR